MAFHLNGYSNFHDDNQDWIVSKIKNIEDAETHTEELAEAARSSADRSEHQAENAAISALNAAQSALESAQSADDSQGSANAAAASEAAAKNYADHIADPVSGLVTDWLEDNITPTTPTVDASLTVSGAAADAKVTGDKITDLKSAITINNNWINGVMPTIEQGGFKNDGTDMEVSHELYDYRLRTKEFMLCSGKIKLICNSTEAILFAASFYAEPSYTTARTLGTEWLALGTEVDVPNDSPYVRFTFRNVSFAALSPSDIYDVEITTTTFHSVNEDVETLKNQVKNTNLLVTDTFQPALEQGGLTDQGINTNPGHVNYLYRVRTKNFISAFNSVETDTNDDIQHSYSFYDEPDYTENRISNTGWLDSGTKVFMPQNVYYFRVIFKKRDGSVVDPSDVTSITVTTDGIAETVKGSVIFSGNNYAISPSLIKEYVHPKLVGALTYLQAFCIYDEYYYSTNGSNISKQDEAFTEVANIAINVGHGNSMQVGTKHPNYAYISGWNDQKVYVVDLDTITIIDTISLPTTGYTTVAIDDVNELAYIFQRDSYPSTEVNYKFIVYDYAGNNVISEKITHRAFSAMQAVEFYEGKIYVLNGLGTAESPNYYLIYNTNGDVISEYVMGDFSNIEPEGVYVDRTTKELYMSFVNRNLYKIC